MIHKIQGRCASPIPVGSQSDRDRTRRQFDGTGIKAAVGNTTKSILVSEPKGVRPVAAGNPGPGSDSQNVGAMLHQVNRIGRSIRAEVAPINAAAVQVGMTFVRTRVTGSDGDVGVSRKSR